MSKKLAIQLIPDFDIEIPPYKSYMDLRERAEAACNTTNLLAQHGLDLSTSEADRNLAAMLTYNYAEDEERASKSVTHSKTASMTPASLTETGRILKEFGRLVATQAAEVRNTVMNKLINETENPDARIRLRALELLGKVSDVGLFIERKEVTVTHQTSDEIQAKIREKLVKLQSEVQDLTETEEGVFETVPETVPEVESE